MGFLDYILGFSAEAGGAFPHDSTDERAWRPFGNREYWGGFAGPALTGRFVLPDDAIGVSCVFAAVRIWCNVLGTAPMRFYRRLPNGEEAPLANYRLARMLSTDGMVNPWQSGAVWKMWNIGQSLLWGLGLNEIKFGSRGLELWPIEGDYITRVDQLDNGKKRFTVSEPGKQTRTLTQDQVYQADGFGTHRLIPESILRRSREAVGAWLAQEQYRSAYYRSGASPSIVFTHPGPQPLSDGALNRLTATLNSRTGGPGNAHRAIVTEEGVTAKAFGSTAKDALLVDAWNNQVLEFSRYFGVPPFMLDATSQLPYASRESAMREWVDVEVKARARLIESALKRDLFLEDDVVCEHDLTELKMGDALAQQQADCGYVVAGIDSVNEVRSRRGMNKLVGAEYDKPRRSANIGTDPGGDNRPSPRPGDPIAPQPPQGPSPAPKKKKKAKRAEAQAAGTYPPQYRQVVTSAARQLLRRETEQVRRRAVQLASDPAAFSAWLGEFYLGHGQKMAEGLALGERAIESYASSHRAELESEGIQACERWESGEAVRLMVEMVVTHGTEAPS